MDYYHSAMGARKEYSTPETRVRDLIISDVLLVASPLGGQDIDLDDQDLDYGYGGEI